MSPAKTGSKTTKAAKRVLVTGGTGFLGRHVVQTLLDDGAKPKDVRVLCRTGDAALSTLGVDVVAGSVTNADEVAKAIKGCGIVYHLAGAVDRSPDAMRKLTLVHVDGTRVVLNAAADVGVRRVVYVSTSGVIACSTDSNAMATEADDYPIDTVRRWPYYLSKIYGEQAALAVARERDLDVVTINPTLLLGPGDERLSSTEDVLRFLRKQVPAIPSGGLAFVDARDAARATVDAATKGKAGERYLLNAANWTVEKFMRRLESLSGVEGPALKLPDRVARWGATLMEWGYDALGRETPVDRVSTEMSQHFWYCSWDKAVADLGFSPRDPDQTLSDTIEDVVTRFGLAVG